MARELEATRPSQVFPENGDFVCRLDTLKDASEAKVATKSDDAGYDFPGGWPQVTKM